MKNKILNIFIKGDARTIKANKNIIASFLFKGVSIIVSFLIVPITLNYLGSNKLGIWLTISSVISWVSFFDIGLSNGLKNRLAESISLKKEKKAKEYVSTTYFLLLLIVGFLTLFFLILHPYINWYNILNIPLSLNENINDVIKYVFIFFSLRFILNTITIIFISHQEISKSNLLLAFNDIVVLVCIYLTTLLLPKGSLLFISIIYTAVPVLVLLVFTYAYFNGKYSYLKPNLSRINLSVSKDLLNTGLNFFVIQIAVLIIFSTDNLIISKVLGPSEVTPYNISFKYFSIISLVFTIIVSPFWVAITDAFTLKEYKWIKKSIKKLIKIWSLMVLLGVILIVISPVLYKLWIGNKVLIPFRLSFFMLIFSLLSTWNNIFAYFINGVGKIKLQMYYSIFAMLINIPLSIYFSKNLNLGSEGVILATCCSLSIGAVFGPIQYVKIINNKVSKNSIWNQ